MKELEKYEKVIYIVDMNNGFVNFGAMAFGHAYPRCIIPYNVLSTIDYDNKKITIDEPMLNYSKQKHL